MLGYESFESQQYGLETCEFENEFWGLEMA